MLLIATAVCVYVYVKAFTPNTQFSQKEVFVYIPTNSTYEDVKGIIEPMVENFSKFDFVATSRKTTTHQSNQVSFYLKKE